MFAAIFRVVFTEVTLIEILIINFFYQSVKLFNSNRLGSLGAL